MIFEAEGLTTGNLRDAVVHMRQRLSTSEQPTCRVVGLAPSTMQYKAEAKDDDGLRFALMRLPFAVAGERQAQGFFTTEPC